MVGIKPFAVEQWMDTYETTPGVLNISETCAASVSIQDLLALASNTTANPLDLISARKLTYGPIRGSDTLRGRIAALYGDGDGSDDASPPPLPAENVLVTAGAIAANLLVFYSLVGPGDHVVCVYPTYQQLYSVPESLGAEVSLWQLKAEQGYVPDLEELERLVKDNTKMIVINNPNNPTGQVIPRKVLQGIVDFARQRGIIVFSDEVYRPLFHSLPSENATPPPSILSFGYEKSIATGSMSKAWSLAGVRLGWIASRSPELVEAFASARDYTTISVSQLDDAVAALALSDEVRNPLLSRNTELARTNLALLAAFVERHSGVCEWVKPQAGTTAFIRFRHRDGKVVDDEQFCKALLNATKVMCVPGRKCFGDGVDFEGFVRVGYVSETDVLEIALERLENYVQENLYS